MQVTVFGASGKVGRLVVKTLLARGHSVVAFVHSHELPAASGLRQVHGDIYDRSSVESALTGSRAVVSALGSWGSKDKNVLSTAMERIIPAMKAIGISRIVSVTGDGAPAPGDKPSLVMSGGRAMLNLFAPKILRDGEDHIRLLSQSDLDWTVLRSPVMITGGEAYNLSTTDVGLTIPRAAVARAMADLVTTTDWTRQAPHIHRGK